MLEYILIGLLHEQPMSGYDLKKTIDYSIGFFYKASFGSLYPALKRLEEKEWVTAKEVEGNSKNKKIYTVNPVGKEAFLKWLAQPLQSSKNEHLLKIFFIDYLDEEKRTDLLQQFHLQLKNERGKLKEVEQIVSEEVTALTNPEDFYYRISVLRYGVRHLEMELDWLEEIIERKVN
ncbi:PadR family transcriptional regulator [Sporosarcina limicola]|uniref:DNA-binding PadR family transcriptional regulator n=1 Tax=Sporosarcina limicola TaxID=34101 RepID=A0A927MEN8_9BACL|nr:PadR family transcriptional regulator [Sporosarcina limicola]MBE1553175.1 DNA-binding PadR family transcriptional regulator [Sporosarcina limicola]